MLGFISVLYQSTKGYSCDKGIFSKIYFVLNIVIKCRQLYTEIFKANFPLQKLCSKIQGRLQSSNSEPIYSSIDSYPIRTPYHESKRRQSDVFETAGVVLVTEYEDTEPLLRVQQNPVQNESDSESSWNDDLGDGQVEVEIYQDKNARFIERDEIFESTCTIDSEQTFLKNNDAPREGASANSSLNYINGTDRLLITSNEKCDVNEGDQIALYCGTLTGDNNERCSSETKQESSHEKCKNGNTSNYEKLGDNADDHNYTLPSPPPIIEEICEEMEQEGISTEQVIEISRANTHNNDDDDDNNTEGPVTNYVSGESNASGETSPP